MHSSTTKFRPASVSVPVREHGWRLTQASECITRSRKSNSYSLLLRGKYERFAENRIVNYEVM